MFVVMRLKGIDIAELDKKVIIEQPTYTRDSLTGEQLKATWTTFATVWSKCDDVTLEKSEADQNVALGDSMWMIRWVSGFNETMRINDGGIYHYVKGIKTTDRNVTITFRTEKRNNV
jgi:head-tail adaptor